MHNRKSGNHMRDILMISTAELLSWNFFVFSHSFDDEMENCLFHCEEYWIQPTSESSINNFHHSKYESWASCGAILFFIIIFISLMKFIIGKQKTWHLSDFRTLFRILNAFHLSISFFVFGERMFYCYCHLHFILFHILYSLCMHWNLFIQLS